MASGVLPWYRYICSCEIFPVLASFGCNCGGVHPNHCIDVRGKISDEINSILKDFTDGKYGPMANEVNVAVILSKMLL